MNFIGSIFTFAICAALVLLTLAIFIPITIFDLVIGTIVNIFGGNWKYTSGDAWNCILTHWSKGEFMF
ncbi:MAG: hypothetical protein IKW20_02195 [Bacteroidales bacterium]|nr:hypothetical protein [Bacteroidales bacterium]MBR5833715.1 hypothetical protein [Bacteroidales bacterium]